MFARIVRSVFGNANDRSLKAYQRRVPRHQRPRTGNPGGCPTTPCAPGPRAFRDRLTKGETLDDLLPEAFAVVREASAGSSACAISTSS